MIRIDRVVTAAFLIGALGGCATGPRLVSAPALAKAKGSVTFKKTPYSGTRIVLNIKNLTEPEELNPPGYTYVAWVQSDREAPPQNVGALAVDDERNGELKTITPLHDFEFFVTVEAASDVVEPTGPPLLWTHRDLTVRLFRRDARAQLASNGTR